MSLYYTCNNYAEAPIVWTKFKSTPKNASFSKGFILANFNGVTQEYVLDKNVSFDNLTLNKFTAQNLITTELAYINNVQNVVDAIKQGKAQKVVLSRRKFIPLSEEKIIQLYTETAKNIPEKLVYKMYNSTTNEFWLGATPEILLSYENNSFLCHALAGTATSENGFTSKEKEEQAFVSNYICNKMGVSTKQHPLETVKAGSFFHLRNQITWNGNAEDIISNAKKLHPTPAVCGIPMEQAQNIITNLEKLPRTNYTGYLGWKNHNKAKLHVNLRCAQLFSNGILLYAGGGITENSDPKSEYLETEMKMEAILADFDIV